MKPDGNRHVMPTDDIKPHEESIKCWCCPKYDPDYPTVVIHNAFAESYKEEREMN